MIPQHDLLFELGSEELPPKNLLSLSVALGQHIESGLKAAGLNYQACQLYATPRRLAVWIQQLAAYQSSQTIEKRGPALAAAFDADGLPTKATMGFAKSCGTTVEQLQTLQTDKGAWLIFKQTLAGQQTVDLIIEIIKQSILALPIAKRMRWGNGTTEFVRPVHWAVLLYANQVVEGEILGLKTGRYSFGHRFHAPNAIEINSAVDYAQQLHSEGQVIADFAQRRERIRQAAIEAAAVVNGIPHLDEDLLNEVCALSELPMVITGEFDAKFLQLPKEVLMTSMQSHQKYFPVMQNNGKLLPYFITFSNLHSSNPESIRQGNQRVILPRLVDAEFFWNQDRKQSLANRLPILSTIVFQQQLGTLADKTHRVQQLAICIANIINADVELASRAALLAKTDLTTHMVNEFANLQGVMGHYYALADGENPQVALALEEHYFPKQAGAILPNSAIGQTVAIADKLDTICGIFSAGLIPTGDKDPYGLRRATLGILRIIIECELPLNLTQLIELALSQFQHSFNRETTAILIQEFIFERLKGYCLDQGFGSDEFDAILKTQAMQPFNFVQRLTAVKQFRALAEAKSLAAANKRIANLLKKSNLHSTAMIGELVMDAEKNLLAIAKQIAAEIEPLIATQQYQAALFLLAQLKQPVDDFFDQVMVNCEDENLRASRLALLSFLANQFLQIADVSKLQI